MAKNDNNNPPPPPPPPPVDHAALAKAAVQELLGDIPMEDLAGIVAKHKADEAAAAQDNDADAAAEAKYREQLDKANATIREGMATTALASAQILPEFLPVIAPTLNITHESTPEEIAEAVKAAKEATPAAFTKTPGNQSRRAGETGPPPGSPPPANDGSVSTMEQARQKYRDRGAGNTEHPLVAKARQGA